MRNFLLLLTILFSSISFAQEIQKNIRSTRISKPPIIDGVLDDEAWVNADVAKDFVMFEPTSGISEKETQKTEVKVVYDNEAIYFGAYLYDDQPDEIPKQLANRDSFGTCDWFGIMINPNNDSQNDTEFIIQVTGNQMDAKSSAGDDRSDFSWSAVWDSEVKIVENGWIVEVKIPYSALRFSNEKIQNWGINFHRHFRNTREQYTWNFIDRTKGVKQQYAGLLTGIKNVKPPTRLSFSPYASAALDIYDGTNTFDKSIGLDVKYGLSESFTLDATLIPDFGQTAFDDLVLNLGPFEQEYQEQRPFFTEGTELFNKGEMFYSRRIGNSPVNSFDEETLNTDEEIINNPDNVNMLNAIKVSGRTKGGLGIGVFNAITEETSAKIRNITTGETRKVTTEPFANYNVLILDQQFNQNSSVSFINTNVLREGKVRDANASGILYTIVNKGNTHFINGSAKMSSIRENGNKINGYSFETKLGKFAGKWQYELEYNMADKNYDINDLGFQRRNDYQRFESQLSYRIFEPTNTFNRFRISTSADLDYRKSDGAYTGNRFRINFFATTVNQFSFGGNINANIGNQYDYYEPRVEDRYFVDSPRLNFDSWVSSDFSKKFSYRLRVFHSARQTEKRTYSEFSFSPRYRFSDKFSINYSIEYGKGKNQKGWVNELDNGAIIFGVRDNKKIENTLSGKYNFSVKSGLSLLFRHYWSPVIYNSQFYELTENGGLIENTYSENHDINFNIWNLDLSYTWQFAPGSQLIALYRNSIFNEDELSNLNFNENLDNLFKEPARHNFSLKFIYYLDYNKIKSWL